MSSDDAPSSKATDWRMVTLALCSVVGMTSAGGAGTLVGSRLSGQDEPAVVVYRMHTLERQLSGLSEQVQDLQSSIDQRTASRFTREDGEAHAAEAEDHFLRVEARLRALEIDQRVRESHLPPVESRAQRR